MGQLRLQDGESSKLIEGQVVYDEVCTNITDFETAVADTSVKSIFLENGLYTLTGNLTLREGLKIIGENQEQTIIDLNGNDISGGGISISTGGTITLNNLSVTVNGVGTNFIGDGVQAGDFILIYELGVFLQVTSVGTNLVLDLEEAWEGPTVGGLNFEILRTEGNIKLKNITFINGGTITLEATYNSIIENCFVDNCILNLGNLNRGIFNLKMYDCVVYNMVLVVGYYLCASDLQNNYFRYADFVTNVFAYSNFANNIIAGNTHYAASVGGFRVSTFNYNNFSNIDNSIASPTVTIGGDGIGKIVGNLFDNCQAVQGLWVANGDRFIISNNNLNNTSNQDIVLDNVNYSIIEGNLCDNLQLTNNSDYNTIDGNRIITDLNFSLTSGNNDLGVNQINNNIVDSGVGNRTKNVWNLEAYGNYVVFQRDYSNTYPRTTIGNTNSESELQLWYSGTRYSLLEADSSGNELSLQYNTATGYPNSWLNVDSNSVDLELDFSSDRRMDSLVNSSRSQTYWYYNSNIRSGVVSDIGGSDLNLYYNNSRRARAYAYSNSVGIYGYYDTDTYFALRVTSDAAGAWFYYDSNTYISIYADSDPAIRLYYDADTYIRLDTSGSTPGVFAYYDADTYSYIYAQADRATIAAYRDAFRFAEIEAENSEIGFYARSDTSHYVGFDVDTSLGQSSAYGRYTADDRFVLGASSSGSSLQLYQANNRRIWLDAEIANGAAYKDVGGSTWDGAAFTACHQYEKGEDLDIGDCVYVKNKKIYKTIKAKQKNVAGLYTGYKNLNPCYKEVEDNGNWEEMIVHRCHTRELKNKVKSGELTEDFFAPIVIKNKAQLDKIKKEHDIDFVKLKVKKSIDSFGNITECYGVAAIGDSKTYSLLGAKICDKGGKVKSGDLLCTSLIPGYLMKQDDDIIHSYTVGKCMEDIDFPEEGDMKGKKHDVYIYIYSG